MNWKDCSLARFWAYDGTFSLSIAILPFTTNISKIKEYQNKRSNEESLYLHRQVHPTLDIGYCARVFCISRVLLSTFPFS